MSTTNLLPFGGEAGVTPNLEYLNDLALNTYGGEMPSAPSARSSFLMDKGLRLLRDRQTVYQLYRSYYRGNHRLLFATNKFRKAFGDMFAAFSCNACPSIVDLIADRLQIEGFGPDNKSTDTAGQEQEGSTDAAVVSGDNPLQGNATAAIAAANQDDADVAWAIWQANRMDRRSGEAHLEALRAGDAYIIVWPDESNNVIIYPQNAANIAVGFDGETPGKVLWAVKAWVAEDTQKARVNLYLPDRVEKWVSPQTYRGRYLPTSSRSMVPYVVEREPWPLPNKWGVVPVFHFGNNASVGEMGVSELNDVIPLQDALNKSFADMMVAGEFHGMPQRWIAGLELPSDPETGEPKMPWQAAVDAVWGTGNPDAKFGQFDAMPSASFVDRIELIWKAISRVSRTPLHFIIPQSGDFPSGESQRVAEGPFLSKVKDRQASFANTWEDAMSLAVRMATSKPSVQLECQWADPAPYSAKETAEVVGLKYAIHGSKRTAERELGYSDEEIEEMEEESQASAQSFGANLLAGAQGGQGQAGAPPAFDRGQMGQSSTMPGMSANRMAGMMPQVGG